MKLVSRNGLVVTPRDRCATNLVCEDGLIPALEDPGSASTGADQEIDARELMVSPGFIDPHVHSRDPELTEKEDFAHSTRAVASIYNADWVREKYGEQVQPLVGTRPNPSKSCGSSGGLRLTNAVAMTAAPRVTASISYENSGGSRAAIIGGSVAGLSAGLALREAGYDVEVFERSPNDFQVRGAGIRARPELLHFLEEHGISSREKVGVPVQRARYLRRDGSVAWEEDRDQVMTSWSAIYRLFKEAFPDDRYHQGSELVGFEQDESGVVTRFRDGYEECYDLLVGADGSDSTCRRQLLPDATLEYAGYVAWRGLVDEGEAEPSLVDEFAGRFTYFMGPNTQMVCYVIPGPSGELAKGERRLNWVWYWNVPEGDELREVLTDEEGVVRARSIPQGKLRRDLVRRQQAVAEEILPAAFERLFALTEEPFIQAIYDLSVPRMAFERACLIGDAAFLSRPHAAASTAKAITNAVKLAKHVGSNGVDIAAALKKWESEQLELGNEFNAYGKTLGDKSQLGRCAPRQGLK